MITILSQVIEKYLIYLVTKLWCFVRRSSDCSSLVHIIFSSLIAAPKKTQRKEQRKGIRSV